MRHAHADTLALRPLATGLAHQTQLDEMLQQFRGMSNSGRSNGSLLNMQWFEFELTLYNIHSPGYVYTGYVTLLVHHFGLTER